MSPHALLADTHLSWDPLLPHPLLTRLTLLTPPPRPHRNPSMDHAQDLPCQEGWCRETTGRDSAGSLAATGCKHTKPYSNMHATFLPCLMVPYPQTSQGKLTGLRSPSAAAASASRGHAAAGACAPSPGAGPSPSAPGWLQTCAHLHAPGLSSRVALTAKQNLLMS